MISRALLALLVLALGITNAYTLVHNYDGNNWYNSFVFQTDPDPTHGFVDYISKDDAASMGMTFVVGDQVYFGVDNETVLTDSTTGRKSIWLESIDSFLHGLLIADFAHTPGSICGLWPSLYLPSSPTEESQFTLPSWTIRNEAGPYGEIDIMEGFSAITQAYTTLHTQDVDGPCSFDSPPGAQTGTSNQDAFDCGGDIGCSVIGAEDSYGTPLNDNGGGIYAMEWTSDYINIYFFPRDVIPGDITSGIPDPSGWGAPTANFESQYGSCDIDAHFPAQTIYFDTTFCGAEAGGDAWTTWTGCAASTGYATCEEFVQENPEVFDEAYWLVNSVKLFQ